MRDSSTAAHLLSADRVNSGLIHALQGFLASLLIFGRPGRRGRSVGGDMARPSWQAHALTGAPAPHEARASFSWDKKSRSTGPGRAPYSPGQERLSPRNPAQKA